MKKLLLLAGILVVSGLSFAAAGAEADLKVKAEIISPLSIETTPVDFGILTKGQRNVNTLGGGSGSIEITGEAERNVKITFNGLNTLGSGASEMTTVILNNTSPTSQSTLTAELKIIENTGDSPARFGDFFANSIALNDNGSKKITVVGSMGEVPANIDSGLYEGTIKVNAAYDFNSNK